MVDVSRRAGGLSIPAEKAVVVRFARIIGGLQAGEKFLACGIGLAPLAGNQLLKRDREGQDGNFTSRRTNGNFF